MSGSGAPFSHPLFFFRNSIVLAETTYCSKNKGSIVHTFAFRMFLGPPEHGLHDGSVSVSVKKKLKNDGALMGNRIPENFRDDTTPPPYKKNISNTPISSKNKK